MLELDNTTIERLQGAMGDRLLANPRYLLIFASPSGQLEESGTLANLKLLGLAKKLSIRQQRTSSKFKLWGKPRTITIPSIAPNTRATFSKAMTLRETLLGFLSGGGHPFLGSSTCNFRADFMWVLWFPHDPLHRTLAWKALGANVEVYGVDFDDQAPYVGETIVLNVDEIREARLV